jgi:uncharacterized protein YndB with AHSA1/START domain
MSDTDRVVIVETTIAAPPEDVWQALRDPGQIQRWHGWEHDGLADEIRQIYVDGAEADDAARTISFPAVATRFELEPYPGGALLRVTKPAPTGDEPWEAFYDEIDEGWTSFVHQLAFALEHHAGEERRTVHLDGRAPAGGGPLTADVLGLDAGDVGEPYEGTTPWGERLTGVVRFRGRNQIGLTVDAFGDGLLVLHAQPPSARPPHGGGKAILTLYGLDDDALDALAERWSGWMAAAYPASHD